MAGAPIGNTNAAKENRWAQAIDRALAQRSRAAGIQALDVLAEKLLLNCDAGDMTALKELGDRLDGKPKQALDVAATGDITITLLSYGAVAGATDPPA